MARANELHARVWTPHSGVSACRKSPAVTTTPALERVTCGACKTALAKAGA